VNAPRAIVIAEGDIDLRNGDVSWRVVTDSLPGFVTVDAFATPIDAANTVLFSSGTTGAPKAIPWTPACAIKAAADAKWHLDMRSADRLLWPTSLGWMMGAWSIFATLLNDATLVVFDDAPTQRELGRLVQSTRVTHLGVVPSLVRSWREARTMEGLDFRSVRVFSSTGECSNPTDMLYLMWLAHYRPIVEYCGGTEIAGGYITSTVLSPCVPSCFTTAALGQNFVCLNEAGESTQQGEAFLTTPSIGLSTSLLNKNHHDEYYANVPQPGLRRHGDLIQQVNGEYYRVLGRADDTMNLGGVKVSSAEIERACQDVPGVQELAAIALAPPGGGPSALVMCVVPAPGRASVETEHNEGATLIHLQQCIRERVNPLFRVERVVFVDALPRTASNKVMRRVLRSRYVELLENPTSAAERTVS
jgi:acetyl-CoA synthetase